MFSRRQQVRIRWGDCDPAGIVFYPRYFEYFNECTELLFDAALGMKKRDWFRQYAIIGIPMVDLRARYFLPCRYGDEVTVDSAFVKLGRASFEIRHALANGGSPAVEAVETRVWAARDPADEARLRAVALPDEVAARLSRQA